MTSRPGPPARPAASTSRQQQAEGVHVHRRDGQLRRRQQGHVRPLGPAEPLEPRVHRRLRDARELGTVRDRLDIDPPDLLRRGAPDRHVRRPTAGRQHAPGPAPGPGLPHPRGRGGRRARSDRDNAHADPDVHPESPERRVPDPPVVRDPVRQHGARAHVPRAVLPGRRSGGLQHRIRSRLLDQRDRHGSVRGRPARAAPGAGPCERRCARHEAEHVRDDQSGPTRGRLLRPRGGHVVLPAAADLRAQRGRVGRAGLQPRPRRFNAHWEIDYPANTDTRGFTITAERIRNAIAADGYTVDRLYTTDDEDVIPRPIGTARRFRRTCGVPRSTGTQTPPTSSTPTTTAAS